jgi:hypothetical protein
MAIQYYRVFFILATLILILTCGKKENQYLKDDGL